MTREGGVRDSMNQPYVPVSSTLTRLTILRTRSSLSSGVIICDASRFTPCASPEGWSLLLAGGPAACEP